MELLLVMESADKNADTLKARAMGTTPQPALQMPVTRKRGRTPRKQNSGIANKTVTQLVTSVTAKLSYCMSI